MKYFVVLLVGVAFFALGNAGTCPRYPLIKDFDFQRYLGMWYQQDKKQAGWEIPGRCWKSFYLRDPKNGQFKLKMIFENTLTRRQEEYDSELSLMGPQKPSVIEYSIPLTFLDSKFQVLATDYNTFSVEYKCDPNGILEKQESVFLLTREQNPPPLVLQKAYAIMHRYGIDIRKLERVDQTCGGMKLSQGPDLPPQTTLQDPDYDYYSVPKQELYESRRSETVIDDTDRTERYDYYDAPPIVHEAPRVQFKDNRRPLLRRLWRPNFNIFG